MIDISSPYNALINRQFSGIPGISAGVPTERDTFPSSRQNTSRGKDQVAISDQGKEQSAKNPATVKDATGTPAQTSSSRNNTLSAQQLAEIQQLKRRDADVRAHEQAHLAVAGRYATGGASYTYQIGPDGVRYAVGGEVPIDVSDANSPSATIQKMETIRRAALAPADPSSADIQIAAEASTKELKAMHELQVQQSEKTAANISHSSKSNTNEQNSSSSSLNISPSGTTGLSSGNNRQIMIKAYQYMHSLS